MVLVLYFYTMHFFANSVLGCISFGIKAFEKKMYRYVYFILNMNTTITSYYDKSTKTHWCVMFTNETFFFCLIKNVCIFILWAIYINRSDTQKKLLNSITGLTDGRIPKRLGYIVMIQRQNHKSLFSETLHGSSIYQVKAKDFARVWNRYWKIY